MFASPADYREALFDTSISLNERMEEVRIASAKYQAALRAEGVAKATAYATAEAAGLRSQAAKDALVKAEVAAATAELEIARLDYQVACIALRCAENQLSALQSIGGSFKAEARGADSNGVW